MITIVMTYFNRLPQLLETIESFKQYDPDIFRVVIVDDGSTERIVLPTTLFEVDILRVNHKTWKQADPAYNLGFYYALIKKTDIIIIQNAECYHYGDIVNYAKHVTNDTYISFGCYSQGKGEAIGSVINNRSVSFDGDSGWYNHPVHRPVGYHFCSAITASNLKKLNGFDERFAFGAGYDDDYFLHQIKCLGLDVKITFDPFVIHQWHENIHGDDYKSNEQIYWNLVQEGNFKAEHLLTQDL